MVWWPGAYFSAPTVCPSAELVCPGSFAGIAAPKWTKWGGIG
jgi:hypothetical protein